MKRGEAVAYDRGYRVNEDGIAIGLRGLPLNPHVSVRGYFKLNIRDEDGSSFEVRLHRLAAYQWFREELYTEGLEVRHLDGNPLNNSRSNLVLGTKSQNNMDKDPAVRKRVALIAAKELRALTEDEVRALRNDRSAGMKYDELSLKYGIGKSTVSYIVNRKTYATVE